MIKLALVIGQYRAADGREFERSPAGKVPVTLLCSKWRTSFSDSKCKFSKISAIYVISKICSEECVWGTEFFQYFTVPCHCICRKLTIWLTKYVESPYLCSPSIISINPGQRESPSLEIPNSWKCGISVGYVGIKVMTVIVWWVLGRKLRDGRLFGAY